MPTSRRPPPSPCRARRCHPPNSRNFCPRLKCRPRSNRCTSIPSPILPPPPATIAVIAPKRSRARASPPRLQDPPRAQLPRDRLGYSSLRRRPRRAPFRKAWFRKTPTLRSCPRRSRRSTCRAPLSCRASPPPTRKCSDRRRDAEAPVAAPPPVGAVSPGAGAAPLRPGARIASSNRTWRIRRSGPKTRNLGITSLGSGE